MVIKQFKYMSILEEDVDTKTRKFSVVSDRGSVIGEIKWYGPFRKYSFFPFTNTVYERQCLRDIAGFLDELMDERRV